MKTNFFKSLLCVFALSVFSFQPAMADFDAGDVIGAVGAIIGAANGSDAFARPGRGGRGGGVTCSANDKGFEEHSGGHNSCGQCLQRHGSCVETCSAQGFVCTAVSQGRRGRQAVFQGFDTRRPAARREAMRECQRNFGDCQFQGCRRENQVVSRQSCGRAEQPGRGGRRGGGRGRR